jgi:DNA helicase-2/ATP-dependent DNA helicase PcrA
MQTGKIHAPAGSGKTTRLIQILTEALERPEVGGDVTRLGFSTFTRKGRQEAAQRAASAWGVPVAVLEQEGYFKTAHSVAFHALGASCGEIIGGNGKETQEWFAKRLAVDLQAEIDEDGIVSFKGDPDFQGALWAWHLARMTMRPVKNILHDLYREGARIPSPSEVIALIGRYEKAKKQDGLTDFDDLLARFAGVGFSMDGPEECDPQGHVPNSVVGWIFDEAQDSSNLLVRAQKRLLTGKSVKWNWVAGDVFQAIHRWNGADPSLFLTWPADRQVTLSQSFRCPPPIVKLGERCLRRLGADYIDRQVIPAEREGEICHAYDIEQALADVSASTSTLVLARTNQNAMRLKDMLKERDIPFEDIRNAGEPNSATIARAAVLRLAQGDEVSSSDVAAILQLFPYKHGGVQLLAGGCKKSWKTRIDKPTSLRLNDLGAAGATEDLVKAISDGSWKRFDENHARFVRIAKKWGLEAAVRPKIKVGTCHAAKGAEADHVVLCTGSTPQISRQIDDSKARYQEECRVEYTAVTRTRCKLTLARDLSTRHQMEVLDL